MKYHLQFDGACYPVNPGGTAAYGFVLSRDEREIEAGQGIIGTGQGMTNNLAEFRALREGLLAFLRHTHEPSVLSVTGDSKLVVEIINERWAGKPDKLYYPEFIMAANVISQARDQGHRVSVSWVPREQNQRCDELSKSNRKDI